MGVKRIRTLSGRLGIKERRRRLSAANLQPGEVIIVDRARQLRKGKRLRNSFVAELRAKAQFAVDLDCRKLVHRIRLRLAQHYADKLSAGERASGRGQLPKLKSKKPKDIGRTRGVETGEMVSRWMMLKVHGSPLSSRTTLKPWGGDGRRFMINRELLGGVDYQSLDGEAAEVVRAATAEWLKAAVGAGDGVATPKRVDLKATTLDRS